MKDKIDTAAFFLWFKVLQAIDSSLYLALQQLQKKSWHVGNFLKPNQQNPISPLTKINWCIYIEYLPLNNR